MSSSSRSSLSAGGGVPAAEAASGERDRPRTAREPEVCLSPKETLPSDASSSYSDQDSDVQKAEVHGHEHHLPRRKRPRSGYDTDDDEGPMAPSSVAQRFAALDQATQEQLRQRLLFQVDVESYLKQKEVAIIEREIARADRAIATLQALESEGKYDETVRAYRSWYANGTASSTNAETNNSAKKASSNPKSSRASSRRDAESAGSASETSLSRTPASSRTATPLGSPKSRSFGAAVLLSDRPARRGSSASVPSLPLERPSRHGSASSSSTPAVSAISTERSKGPAGAALYARRPDGTYVRLICHICGRKEFNNILGLHNHCRLKHNVEFAGQDESTRVCGVPVDVSEVPPEHPCHRQRIYADPLQSSINICDLTAGVVQTKDDAEEDTTRFHLKRRVKIGNVSRYIPVNKRKRDEEPKTHDWMVYVETPKWADPAEGFITRARFYLDPSFAPNHVVDLVQAPFQLQRRGWGEFTLRIQLFFVDPAKNKRADYFLPLKLDKAKLNGEQVLGNEIIVDIELDRSTDFTIRELLADEPNDEASGNRSGPASTREASGESSGAQESGSFVSNAGAQACIVKMDCAVDDALEQIVREAPLIRSQGVSTGQKLRYRAASAMSEYLSYAPMRRKAIEWLRSRCIRAELIKLQEQHQERLLRQQSHSRRLRGSTAAATASSTALATAELPSTWDIVQWCRGKGYTPPEGPMVRAGTSSSEPSICGICGQRHASGDLLHPRPATLLDTAPLQLGSVGREDPPSVRRWVCGQAWDVRPPIYAFNSRDMAAMERIVRQLRLSEFVPERTRSTMNSAAAGGAQSEESLAPVRRARLTAGSARATSSALDQWMHSTPKPWDGAMGRREQAMVLINAAAQVLARRLVARGLEAANTALTHDGLAAEGERPQPNTNFVPLSVNNGHDRQEAKRSHLVPYHIWQGIFSDPQLHFLLPDPPPK